MLSLKWQKYIFFIAILGLLLFGYGRAQAYTTDSIPPACLWKMITQNKSRLNLDIDDCSKLAIEKNPYMQKQGFIGGEIHSTKPVMKSISIFYKVAGIAKSGEKILEVLWSGGGSGNFSDILYITKNKNQLLVTKQISGGDRCNGGISNVKLSNGKLSYQTNATPYALVTQGKQEVAIDERIKLADCAICCIGKFQINDNKLRSFEWNGEIPSEPEQQSLCLSNLLKHATEKQKKIDAVMLRQLQKSWFEKCL